MTDLYLFRNTLRDLARPGKVTAAALMIGLVAFIAVIARTSVKAGEFHPDLTYNLISAALVFGFMLTIFSVVFATGVLIQEIEQKTIPYLLTRPIPRWRILLVKYIAAVAATTLVTWTADIVVALIVFGPGRLTHSRLGQDLAVLPVGALAYSALFLLLATVFSRALLIGLAYAFSWEILVPNLPGDWAKLSLMSYLHALAPHLDTTDSSFTLQILAPSDTPAWLAWVVLSGVISVGLLAALVLFSQREYTPREETT